MGGVIDMADKRIWRAAEIAARVHAGQTRKGDGAAPYISHPMRVGLYLARAGLGPDVVAAGLLHDTIEDAPAGERERVRREIREKVGPQALALVEGVTEQNPEADWQSRKSAYLKHLESAPREALAVSCADKLDNTLGLLEVIETQGREGTKRFNRPIGTKTAYYEAVADAAGRLWPDCPILPALRGALAKLRGVVNALR